MIHEKSQYLIDKQKINLKAEKITWIENLEENFKDEMQELGYL